VVDDFAAMSKIVNTLDHVAHIPAPIATSFYVGLKKNFFG